MGSDDVAALLAGWREAEQAATEGGWYAEPPTGAGRVWVQIGRKRWPPADCEPLFNVRYLGTPASEEERQREFRQREADARFIVTARTAMPCLVAAVEAVLEQVDHFATEADRFGKLSETADEESGAALAALAAWQAYDRCAKTFREAITAALTGEPENESAHSAPTGEDWGS